MEDGGHYKSIGAETCPKICPNFFLGTTLEFSFPKRGSFQALIY